MMRRSMSIVAAALVILLCNAPAVPAQDQSPVFGRIADWQIARTSWDAWTADYKKNTVPVMDKLVADGVLIEYGADENNIHTEDGYTHSTWFVARSMAGVEKALTAIVESGRKMSAEERRKQDTEFSGTKHSDRFVRSILYRTKPARWNGGYVTARSVTLQPGKGSEFVEYFNKYNKPVYEQMLADGTIGGYGIDVEQVYTNNPGVRTIWVLIPNAEGLDKVRAAFSAAAEKATADERQAARQAVRDIFVIESTRDYQGRLITWVAK